MSGHVTCPLRLIVTISRIYISVDASLMNEHYSSAAIRFVGCGCCFPLVYLYELWGNRDAVLAVSYIPWRKEPRQCMEDLSKTTCIFLLWTFASLLSRDLDCHVRLCTDQHATVYSCSYYLHCIMNHNSHHMHLSTYLPSYSYFIVIC